MMIFFISKLNQIEKVNLNKKYFFLKSLYLCQVNLANLLDHLPVISISSPFKGQIKVRHFKIKSILYLFILPYHYSLYLKIYL